MERRAFLAATGGAIVPFVTGCLGGGGGGTEDTPASTPTPTQSPTTSPTPTAGASAQERYPDYNWGMLEDADPVATDAVTLKNTSFNPLVAAVKPGTEVTFTNEDSFGHTVTIPKLGVDEQLDGGQSTAVTFEETGTFDYVCTVHPPDMLGRMVVTEDTPTEMSGETPTPTPTETEDGGGYY